MVRFRVTVGGRVQGVGYRVSCMREATRLGVAGSVRNLPDGTVEVVAEGDEAAVESMIDWCRNGPRYARVGNVDVVAESFTGIRGFTIDP